MNKTLWFSVNPYGKSILTLLGDLYSEASIQSYSVMFSNQEQNGVGYVRREKKIRSSSSWSSPVEYYLWKCLGRSTAHQAVQPGVSPRKNILKLAPKKVNFVVDPWVGTGNNWRAIRLGRNFM